LSTEIRDHELRRHTLAHQGLHAAEISPIAEDDEVALIQGLAEALTMQASTSDECYINMPH
jgi:hypothetical protein